VPKIVVVDGNDVPSPEDSAMLQALYSRSAASVNEHLEKVRRVGSGRFMENYVLGFGHKSIADCGTTTIFVEGVSQLATKAIQDSALYSGQETSSRFIDFAAQPLVDPVGTADSARILARWMEFYREAQPDVIAHVRGMYPRQGGEDDKVYDKAVRARAFDVLRGFLPAAVTTQLSWHTNLRQAADRLAVLRNHPLDEVRNLAREIEGVLRARYPHSFAAEHRQEQEQYRRFAGGWAYHDVEEAAKESIDLAPRVACGWGLSREGLAPYRLLLDERPPRAELPYWMNDLGTVTFSFLLDYGSFRDLQRHRSGVRRMPLLGRQHGFHPWYVAQLPASVLSRAQELIKEQVEAVAHLGAAPEVEQYYLPFGILVACRETYGLPALVYICELRSTKFVHPTLRAVVRKMAHYTKDVLGVPVHASDDPDDFDVRRGKQDISVREGL